MPNAMRNTPACTGMGRTGVDEAPQFWAQTAPDGRSAGMLVAQVIEYRRDKARLLEEARTIRAGTARQAQQIEPVLTASGRSVRR